MVFTGEEVLIKLKARDARLKHGGRSISKACQRGVIVKANHRTHHYTVEYSSKTGNKDRISLKADDICLMTKQAEQLRVTQSREDAGLPGNDYSDYSVVGV